MPKKNKQEANFEELIQEVSIAEKTDEDILEKMQSYYSANATNIENFRLNEVLYETGGDLTRKEYGRQKVIMQIIKRFCKIHASYILKEHPNINVRAKNEEIPDSNKMAANVKKSLNLWWREQNITRKLKRAVRKASYKGMMAFYLSNDTKNKTFSFNVLDPEKIAYERVSDDPTSPLLWFSKGEQISVDILKKAFPKYKDKITNLKSSKFFQNYNGLNILSKLLKDEKAFYFEFIDGKHIYKYINDLRVDKIEHNYPFIPAYIFPYFEMDSEKIVSLLDYIKEPVKMINQAFGYRLDFTDRHSDPPLKVTGNSKELDPSKIKGGIIELKDGGDASFVAPQAASIDIEKFIELGKAFLHFQSGMSEEAMAGFTGALTAAGVSIEFRLDSTVREAIDTQIILQDILQQINRDYLRLMEITYPNKNLFNNEILGVTGDKKFEAKMIAGLYDNTVDFGGILPRSQDQIVRNTVTKYSTGMLSLETALADMNYSDPGVEVAKLRQETIERGKMEKSIQEGKTVGQKFFESPNEENRYMFETGQMATVAPEQDHELHVFTHEEVMEKLSPNLKSLFALHIQMHRKLMEDKGQIQTSK